MKNIPLLVGTIIGSLLLVGALAFFFSGPTATQTGPTTVDMASLTQGARNIKGGAVVSPSATPSAQATASAAVQPVVTIVEFSDFQCPACRAAQPAVTQVLQKYGAQVQLVFKHFPLDTIHPNARLAAQASEVAAAQGQFWPYHDLLFVKQPEWEKIADKSKLLEYFGQLAAQLGLDVNQFVANIEKPEIAALVQADSALGDSIKIQATPTFLVNGQAVSAPQLLTTVEQLVVAQ